MADGVEIKIRNLDLMLRKLKRVAPNADQELDAALEKSANEYVGLVKPALPFKSGQLRDSVRAERVSGFARFDNVKTKGGKSAKSVRRYGQRRTVTETRLVSAEVSYGIWAAFHWTFQEFGTIHQAARPVFFPIYRLLRKRIKGRANRALRKAVKDALKS
ncbi:HK97-gp10 family putative phage morphogenesis protein [uncultured Roseibium sp.]|uniref:HK97-gp10 family putative phage morphogenesis protein n=1 Tax=uncultured Roseibium sp. TaxID=1936171 RepID=UPI00341264E1